MRCAVHAAIVVVVAGVFLGPQMEDRGHEGHGGRIQRRGRSSVEANAKILIQMTTRVKCHQKMNGPIEQPSNSAQVRFAGCGSGMQVDGDSIQEK